MKSTCNDCIPYAKHSQMAVHVNDIDGLLFGSALGISAGWGHKRTLASDRYQAINMAA